LAGKVGTREEATEGRLPREMGSRPLVRTPLTLQKGWVFSRCRLGRTVADATKLKAKDAKAARSKRWPNLTKPAFSRYGSIIKPEKQNPARMDAHTLMLSVAEK